ncbi:MAG: type I DNA topoisomerase [Deferribacteraceae bacterium]|jgi:DNA topoisomerase-1|nr:type I DNA topoisomerase [Deferribacteraceae bacterium]
MSNSLVIVESPGKAKTIENYLGKGFKVLSSIGHIMDLPEKELGVDIQNNFAPTYKVIEGKEKVIAGLKKAASEADIVYLASDPDREGEAIAWHICEQLKSKKKPIKRIQFYEITKQGVLDGIAHPGEINLNRVDAQQSRRILDRLVGYQVSPLLWRPLKYGLSAGRVQTVALRMVCEREKEIEEFVTEEWWSLDGNFEVYEGAKVTGVLKAALDKKNGKKIEMKTESDALDLIDALKNAVFAVDDVEKKNVKNAAPAPFITARLQQDGIRRLGFTAQKVMRTAQQLYEGVELGKDGPAGLITYMRTDSTRISSEAAAAAVNYIKTAYGDNFLGGGKTQSKSKAAGKKNVQDAHEAIRPTEITRTPDKVKQYLNNDQFRLYKLIWERFIASQMADARYEQTTALINGSAGKDNYLFRASGRVMTFAGYTVLYTEAADEDAKAEDNAAFLKVSKENGIKPLPKPDDYDKKQHFTQPPPRYTEASLGRALEQQGIGRPSTYASILSTITDRQYVEILEKRMHPTELGRIVAKLLVQNFPRIFDMKFTALMEEELDKIESGDTKWLKTLNDFYKDFSGELQTATKKLSVDLRIDEKCPECGKDLTIKYGKKGTFVACTGYPDCGFTTDFKRDQNGRLSFVARSEPESTGYTCEKCGCELVIKNSRYGEMLACSGYPDCKNIKSFIRLKDGAIRLLNAGEKLGQDCPECGDGNVILKSGRNGLFAACSGYPDCKFTASVEADDQGNLQLKMKAAPETMGVCEKCGSPMVVKKTFRGPFLACSGYPKCKNTKSMKVEKSDNVPVTVRKTAKKTPAKGKSTKKPIKKGK